MDVLGNEKASFSSSSHRHRARARLAPREHPPVGNEVMDFAMTSRTEAATEADASFGMEDTPAADLYGFGTLVSPILSLPFAKTNQMEWKFKANLVGEKILNPAIFLCDHCNLPILIYGRMIPCKHVFCFACANKSDKFCLRCSDEIFKIEKCNLGTVFMCQTESCKRTYLSQRDLEAHIKHRHVRKPDLTQRL